MCVSKILYTARKGGLRSHFAPLFGPKAWLIGPIGLANWAYGPTGPVKVAYGPVLAQEMWPKGPILPLFWHKKAIFWPILAEKGDISPKNGRKMIILEHFFEKRKKKLNILKKMKYFGTFFSPPKMKN